MTIQTEYELDSYLSQEFAWRKKELHELRTPAFLNRNTHRRDACIRGAVALLYAHWEGFIKNVGTAYLEFVFHRRLKYRELPPHFLALSARRLLNEGAATSAIEQHLEVTEFFLNGLDRDATGRG
jgi:hypothetical protein